MKPRVSIIVAMAKNRVIGANNALPWHLSADLKRFKALTMGHHIIMGRKTFESIGRVLPGRTSVVVSRNSQFQVPGAKTVRSVGDAMEAGKDDSEIFIIGGEEIFRSALPLADRVYVTEIDRDFEGNVRFPELDPREWQAIERTRHRDPDQQLDYAFAVLDRIPA